MYNNTYDKITLTGINVRQGGYSLIEKNWFQNSLDPIVCYFDGGSNCGFWDLRGNNITSPANFATYGITWSTPASGDKNASAWTTTGTFPLTLPYTYEPVTAQCAKDKLASYAGVGKNGAQLTAAACGAATSSSSSAAASSVAASSVAASSSSSRASSSVASSVASSAASSAAASSAASSASGGGTPPVLAGTGDYPTGFSKCADLNGTCSTGTGTGWVAFGRGGKWVLKFVGKGASTACTVAVFGSDPGGNPNKCSKQN
jgi:pectate lyase